MDQAQGSLTEQPAGDGNRVGKRAAMFPSELHLLRTILQTGSDPVLVKDRLGRFLWVNDACAGLVGHSAANLIGKTDRDVFPPEQAQYFWDCDQRIMASGVPESFEESIPFAGNIRTYLTTKTPYRDRRGEVVGIIGIARDITLRKQAEDMLHVTEDFYQLLVQNASDLVVVMDSRGTIRYQSPSHLRVLGYTPGELCGENAFDLVHPDDVQRTLGIFAEAVKTPGITPPVEFRFRHKDGSWRALEAVGTNCLDIPAVKGIVVNCWDVTERARLRAERKATAAALEAANAELDAFAYQAAHDLRNPLTSIQSCAMLQYEGPNLSADGKESLEGIFTCVDRMAALIEDLLRLAQVTKHELQVQQSVNTEALVADVLAGLAPQMTQYGTKVTRDALPGVAADPRLLRQVFQNLLANAVKYSREATPPHIHVGYSRAGENHRFWVGDNGVGFEADQADRLFRAFQRLHADKFEGTGVGLALVRRIVERHGGRCWAKGTVGQGACFYFTLPRQTKAGDTV